MRLSKGSWISLLVILLLVIDQVIKFAVKLNMTIGESIPVFGNWFQICFIENNGMAFGMQFGGSIGKLASCMLITSFVSTLFVVEDKELSAIEGELIRLRTKSNKNNFFIFLNFQN